MSQSPPWCDRHAGNYRFFSPLVPHREHHASDKRDNRSQRAIGTAARSALISLCT